eukprot:1551047-Amphidinium_carterae.3
MWTVGALGSLGSTQCAAAITSTRRPVHILAESVWDVPAISQRMESPLDIVTGTVFYTPRAHSVEAVATASPSTAQSL